MDGLLVIDKPSGITSRDAVNQVQRLLPRKTKIGHTGTLDPLATGVLVMCIGRATKLADKVQAMSKQYLSTFRLGAFSTTDDADSREIVIQTQVAPLSLDVIREGLNHFVGEISQVPPDVSAVKVGGRRAHDLARRGMDFKLEARTVTVQSISIQSYEWPFLEVLIDCSKGTYIRSIARDLGRNLHFGGLVETLRRTRVGPFAAETGLKLPTSRESVESGIIHLDHLASVVEFDHNGKTQ